MLTLFKRPQLANIFFLRVKSAYSAYMTASRICHFVFFAAAAVAAVVLQALSTRYEFTGNHLGLLSVGIIVFRNSSR